MANRLKLITDGLDGRSGEGQPMASGRFAPIEIDSILSIDADPKEYLEGRVAFYIALLEELVRRGASRGDIYFMKDCLDALLKMTSVGRAKVDVNMGLNKARDEIDFTKHSTDELAAFISHARREVDVRHDGNGDNYSVGDAGSVNDNPKRPRRSRRKAATTNGDATAGHSQQQVNRRDEADESSGGDGSGKPIIDDTNNLS